MKDGLRDMRNAKQLISALVLTLALGSQAFACGSTFSLGQKKCCGITMTIAVCAGLGNVCDFGANWRDCGTTGCQINSADNACFNRNVKRNVAFLREPDPEFQRNSVLACNAQQTAAFNEWLEGKLHSQNQ